MKHSIMIQRLCLFLLVLVLAAPAWATDYNRYGYETFRSRKTVETLGKNKQVKRLKQGHVEIYFSECKTTSGTGSGAIYELTKGYLLQCKSRRRLCHPLDHPARYGGWRRLQPPQGPRAHQKG